MSKRAHGMLAGVAALAAFAIAQPASALTMKQCSEKYKTANDAGSVGTMSWNDFRKAECGEGATMALKKVKTEKTKPDKIAPTTAAAGPSMQECSASFKAAKEAGTLERHELERVPQGRLRGQDGGRSKTSGQEGSCTSRTRR